MGELLEKAQGEIIYQQLSKYPSITRDIALVVPSETHAGDLVETVRKTAGKYLHDVFVFDVYEGERLEAGNRSIALRLVYLNKEETLTDAEVEASYNPVIQALEAQGAHIR